MLFLLFSVNLNVDLRYIALVKAVCHVRVIVRLRQTAEIASGYTVSVNVNNNSCKPVAPCTSKTAAVRSSTSEGRLVPATVNQRPPRTDAGCDRNVAGAFKN